MEICRKIDIHAHAIPFAQYEFIKGIEATEEDLFRLYDTIGVDHGVLQPIVSPEGMTCVLSNGAICDMAHRHPERFYWFCGLDARMLPGTPETDFSEMLNFYKSNGAKGVGELTGNLYADDPRLDNLFYHCAECDMPVTIHIAPSLGGFYGIVDEIGLPRITKMLKKYPKLKILGHSQPFWAEISDDCTAENRFAYPQGSVREGNLARILRECPNLYMDMSAFSCYNAMTRDPDYSYRFIEEFGDRMMYAIDYCNPTNRHIYNMAEWLDDSYRKGCISEKNYRGICRENAIRILKL